MLFFWSPIMSPQDAQLLQDFLSQLTQVHGVSKDPEAEAMIARAVAQQPDAAYLLVQRALLLQQALNSAKAEIAALQNQLRSAPQSASAFLDPNAWGNGGSARPAPALQSAPAGSAQYQPPAYQQPAPAPGGFLRGGLGSTLGNIAATAAGVAGGAFLFQGLENLFTHHPGNGFLGAPSGFGALTEPVENINVNNYYGNDNPNQLADTLGAGSVDSLDADTPNDLDTDLFDPNSDDDGLFT
jgi:hypothetical protein